MNTWQHLIGFVLIFLLNTLSFAEIRTWTSVGGSTMEAEFIKTRAGIALFKKADGKVIRFPIHKLSQNDRDYIKAQSSTTPANLNSASSKKISPEMEALLDGQVLRNDKEENLSYDLLGTKIIGVLHCRPSVCGSTQKHLPQIQKVYKKFKSRKYDFEILTFAHDYTEEEFLKGLKDCKIKFPSVHYNKEVCKKLRYHEVPKDMYFPVLIVYDGKGRLITQKGFDDIKAEGYDAFEKWMKTYKEKGYDQASL